MQMYQVNIYMHQEYQLISKQQLILPLPSVNVQHQLHHLHHLPHKTLPYHPQPHHQLHHQHQYVIHGVLVMRNTWTELMETITGGAVGLIVLVANI